MYERSYKNDYLYSFIHYTVFFGVNKFILLYVNILFEHSFMISTVHSGKTYIVFLRFTRIVIICIAFFNQQISI